MRPLYAFLAGTLIIQGTLFFTATYWAKNEALSELKKHSANVASIPAPEPLAAPSREFTDPSPLKQQPVDEEISRVEAPEPKVEVEQQSSVQVYKVQPGDTLGAIWRKNGVDEALAIKAAEALKKAGVDVRSIKAGEELEIEKSPDGKQILKLTKSIGQGKSVILTADGDSDYKAEIETAPLTVKEKVAVGTIHRSFSMAAARENVPVQVVDQLVDLFGSRVAFRKEIQPGDQFAIIYDQKVFSDGEEIAGTEVEAASLQVGDKFFAAVRYVGPDGRTRYFDESGQPMDRNFLRYPVQFSKITSEFTHKRFHPILQKYMPHFGVDFAAPSGTPVRATADGIVTFAGWKGGAGNMILIKHDQRYQTGYMHLSKIGVKPGTRVRRGDVIGRVGATGLATGPHLHYSFYDNGKQIDPFSGKLPLLTLDSKNMIGKTYLIETIERLNQYHAIQKMAALDSSTDTKA